MKLVLATIVSKSGLHSKCLTKSRKWNRESEHEDGNRTHTRTSGQLSNPGFMLCFS